MTQTNKSTPPQRPSVDRQIDENLKRVYDEALNEELPDRFKDLLSQLKSGKMDKSNDG
jgi:hypothetical protein